jgi:uncharacterized RDD family membrane protein YckC
MGWTKDAFDSTLSEAEREAAINKAAYAIVAMAVIIAVLVCWFGYAVYKANQ